MSRLLPPVVIIFGWFFASTILLLATIGLYSQAINTKKLGPLVKSITHDLTSNYQLYSPKNPATLDLVTAITAGDARSVLLERFLTRQRSPMQGAGEHFVAIADQYNLDYRLIPAIAQKESGLGRVMPKGSYNAWGWAIFSGQNSGAEFDSWEHGIETVAKGIKKNYVDRGLVTPEQIMTKYTPSSDGSWAHDVVSTMNQIEEGS